MKVLVTGATGFLGKAAIRLAVRHDVTGTAIADDRGTEILGCDLRDRMAVHAMVERLRPDCVLHCGAVSGPMLAREPGLLFDVNVGGTLNIAEAARMCGVRRVVFASSIAVYGRQPSREPVPESAPLMADDAYGASKIASEVLLRSYSGVHFEAVALRISSVFGPGRQVDCLIQQAARAARSQSSLRLAGNGRAPRQFVHIEDAAAALVRAIDAPSPAQFAYNISGGSYLSEENVAALIAARLPGLRVETAPEAPAQWPDGDIGPLDIAAARRDLGYAPAKDFAAALDDYIALLASDTGSEELSARKALR
jgi:nucleoside-diphosphate-sugar epimerase